MYMRNLPRNPQMDVIDTPDSTKGKERSTFSLNPSMPKGKGSHNSYSP